jgi:DNA-directed RNA polymerase II subunit RPB11
LKRACAALITQTLNIKQQFLDQAKNIEMGMGPEQSGVGAFDPYGDGLGNRGAAPAAAPGDVYDF